MTTDTQEISIAPQSGTLRMLLAIHGGLTMLNCAIVLAYRGEPRDAGFAMGDDLTMGNGEFADSVKPAEFHHSGALDTGLWIAEWDWKMEDDEFGERGAAYSEERWTAPTITDLIAFDMLPRSAPLLSEDPTHAE